MPSVYLRVSPVAPLIASPIASPTSGVKPSGPVANRSVGGVSCGCGTAGGIWVGSASLGRLAGRVVGSGTAWTVVAVTRAATMPIVLTPFCMVMYPVLMSSVGVHYTHEMGLF